MTQPTSAEAAGPAEASGDPRARVPIIVRRMKFELSESVPKYWHSGSPFLTHYFTALSIFFPGGEKFFIDSVRYFEGELRDSTTRAEVRAFVQQEAHHTLQHRLYNELATRNGVPAQRYERWNDRTLKLARKLLSRKAQLAMTIALEHFTAVFANQLLTNPKFTDGMHPDVKPLWLWHAVEETEHKAVAWDVYQQIGGRYWLRALTMARVMIGFPFGVGLVQLAFLAADRKLFDLRDLAKGLRFLWGRGGFIRSVTPELLAFYRRDFHPWQMDNRALVAAWTERYQHYVVSQEPDPGFRSANAAT